MSPPTKLIFSELVPLAIRLPFTCSMQLLGICMVTPGWIVKVVLEATVRFPVNVYGLSACVQVVSELIIPFRVFVWAKLKWLMGKGDVEIRIRTRRTNNFPLFFIV